MFLLRVKDQLTFFIQKYSISRALGLSTLIFAVNYILGTSGFMTNDDAAMMFWASGTLTAVEPSEYLIFTHILIGKLLAGIYTLAPSVPWYGLYLVGGLYTSYVFIIYAGFRLLEVEMATLLVLILTAISPFLLLSMQFTIVAGLLAIAGIIYLRPVCRGHLLLSFLLLLIASMIRYKSFIAVGLCSTPFLFLLFLQKDQEIIKSSILTLLIAAGACFLMQQYHIKAYEKEPDWANYIETNNLRWKLVDYKVYKNNPELLDEARKSVGWSKNDFIIMQNTLIFDKDVFSNEKMRKFISFFPSYKHDFSIPHIVLNFLKSFYLPSCFLLILTIFGLLKYLKLSQVEWVTIGCLIGTSLALVFLMILFLKPPPERVTIILLMAVLINFIFYEKSISRPDTQGKSFQYATLLSIFIFICSIYGFIELSNQNRIKQAVFENKYKSLRKYDENLMVSWASGYIPSYISPFSNLKELKTFRLVGLGSQLRSPYTTRIMKEVNVNPDLFLAITLKGTILLLKEKSQKKKKKLLKILNRYYAEHYGRFIVPTHLESEVLYIRKIRRIKSRIQ